MKKVKKMKKIIFISLLFFINNMALAVVPLPQGLVPAVPEFDAKAFALMDAKSGEVIAEKNADTHLPPASLTKLMTTYVTAKALKAGEIKETDQVPISANAWRMGGSKMFIKVGDKVPVKQLFDGVITASGNDASVALAEFIGGTEPTFVQLMNRTAAELGMKNSHFTDSNGLPAADHYSSARDMAILARAWIYDFPEYYPWFKEKWITYNGIKQPNRNRLLWRDSSVDGMKTGHTDEAGFCVVATAERNGTRLIAAVLGTPNDMARFDDAESLLNYGFRFFESHKLYAANVEIAKPKIWLGKDGHVAAVPQKDVYVTVPTGKYQDLKATVALNKAIEAPIVKGQVLGALKISLDGKELVSMPLVAEKDVAKENFLFSIFDRIVLGFEKIF